MLGNSINEAMRRVDRRFAMIFFMSVNSLSCTINKWRETFWWRRIEVDSTYIVVDFLLSLAVAFWVVKENGSDKESGEWFVSF